MNVMMLAAGEGTRLRPYTLIRPKPAIPFLNIPLACYPLALLEDMKVDRLVVNTFHLPTKIVDLFNGMNHGARRLHFSHEINQILDTGGGLGFAREYFQERGDLIMMNSDEVILPMKKGILKAAYENHQKNKALCTLLTMDYPGVGSKFGGVWLDKDDKVVGFGKTAPNDRAKKAEHFIGLQILSDKIFDYLPNGTPANILYDAVTKALGDRHLVQRHKVDCHWHETGNPHDYLSANAELLKMLADKNDTSYAKTHLQETLARFSKEPSQLEVHNNCTLYKSKSTTIEAGSQLSGFVVAGPESYVSKGAQIKNVILADHVRISSDVKTENELFLKDSESLLLQES